MFVVSAIQSVVFVTAAQTDLDSYPGVPTFNNNSPLTCTTFIQYFTFYAFGTLFWTYLYHVCYDASTTLF